jgi:hypothetical protein
MHGQESRFVHANHISAHDEFRKRRSRKCNLEKGLARKRTHMNYRQDEDDRFRRAMSDLARIQRVESVPGRLAIEEK